jgi:hypothetical protein
MPIVPMRDVGEFLQPGGLGYFNATAGGTGDATEVDGATFDRHTYGMPQSGLLYIQWITSLTADKTLAFTVTLQESDDDSTWSDVSVSDLASAITVKTGAATDDEDFWTCRVRMSGLKRYVRMQVKPDLSHTSTDTAIGNFHILAGPGRDTGLLDAADADND